MIAWRELGAIFGLGSVKSQSLLLASTGSASLVARISVCEACGGSLADVVMSASEISEISVLKMESGSSLPIRSRRHQN